jgi:hypothetical protein
MKYDKSPLTKGDFNKPWYKDMKESPGFTPSANPVLVGTQNALTVAPSVYDKKDFLVEGLKQLNPALEQFAKSSQEIQNQKDEAQGIADHAAGKEYNNVNNSRAYEQAYLTMKGRADAVDIKSNLLAIHEQWKQANPEEHKEAIQNYLKTVMNDGVPPDVLRGMLPGVQETLNHIGVDYTSTQLQIVKDEYTSNFFKVFNSDRQSFAAGLKQSGVSLDDYNRQMVDYDRHAADELISRSKMYGVSAKDAISAFAKMKYATGKQEKDPTALDWIWKSGKDGFASADTALGPELRQTQNQLLEDIKRMNSLDYQDRERNTQTDAHRIMTKIASTLSYTSSQEDKEAARQELKDFVASTILPANINKYNPLGKDQIDTLNKIFEQTISQFSQSDSSDAVQELARKGLRLTVNDLGHLAPKITQSTYMWYLGKVDSVQQMMTSIGIGQQFAMWSQATHNTVTPLVDSLKPKTMFDQMAIQFDPKAQDILGKRVATFSSMVGDWVSKNKGANQQAILEKATSIRDWIDKNYPLTISNSAKQEATKRSQPVTHDAVRESISKLP